VTEREVHSKVRIAERHQTYLKIAFVSFFTEKQGEINQKKYGKKFA
jgi:hypothetical protein